MLSMGRKRGGDNPTEEKLVNATATELSRELHNFGVSLLEQQRQELQHQQCRLIEDLVTRLREEFAILGSPSAITSAYVQGASRNTSRESRAERLRPAGMGSIWPCASVEPLPAGLGDPGDLSQAMVQEILLMKINDLEDGMTRLESTMARVANSAGSVDLPPAPNRPGTQWRESPAGPGDIVLDTSRTIHLDDHLEPRKTSSPSSPGSAGKTPSGPSPQDTPGAFALAPLVDPPETPQLMAKQPSSMRSSSSLPKDVKDDVDRKGSFSSDSAARSSSRLSVAAGRTDLPEESDSCLAGFVAHPAVENTVMAVIMANSVFIGFCTQYAVENLQNQTTLQIQVAEFSFHGFYILELLLRLWVWKCRFFIGKEWRWNIFDFFMAMSAVLDIYVFVLTDDEAVNITFIRTFRLLKAVKVLRMVRVLRFFRELRLMMCSIVGSLASLAWSLVMLIAVMYLGALVFVQAATPVLAEPGDVDPDTIKRMLKYWGGIYTGISTIWMAISGGNDWFELAEPLKSISELYFLIFELFIAFMVLAVLNILTGIFVEHAMQASSGDRDNIVWQHQQEHESFFQDVRQIFLEIDTEDLGVIRWEQFKEHMADPKLEAYFLALDIDAKDAAFFFKLLSGNHLDAGVNFDMFFNGCQRLKGSARMMDVQALACQIKVLFAQVETLGEYMEEMFHTLAPHKHIKRKGLKASQSMRDHQEVERFASPVKQRLTIVAPKLDPTESRRVGHLQEDVREFVF